MFWINKLKKEVKELREEVKSLEYQFRKLHSSIFMYKIDKVLDLLKSNWFTVKEYSIPCEKSFIILKGEFMHRINSKILWVPFSDWYIPQSLEQVLKELEDFIKIRGI